jgi:DNA-binding NtrC family response regulator
MARILLIEDSEMMRKYLCRCLVKGGHDVEEWMPMSAMDIPEKLKEANPDLLLTDYRMAGCNGATIAKVSLATLPAMPVVVLTATRDDTIAETLQKFKVADLLYKPITAEALVAAVDKALLKALQRI